MNDADKELLLKLARESIETYFSGKKPDVSHAKKFSEKQGVFVSLHDKRGKLRGCIGYPHATHQVYIAIVEAARSAAFGDNRFEKLKQEELEDISIEISILTKPTLIEVSHYNEYTKKIILGQDGLIVDNPQGSGLLLPQVAVENNFNIQNYLNCVCQKAGLSFNAWRDNATKLYKFQAEVFSEKK